MMLFRSYASATAFRELCQHVEAPGLGLVYVFLPS